MGLLVDGQWVDQWYDTGSNDGKFARSESQFRNWVTADGSAGPSGEGGFKAEADRYHLYVSLVCPWAHRTLILRKLKGLDSMITVSVVNPYMREHGWTFIKDEGVVADPIFNADYCNPPSKPRRLFVENSININSKHRPNPQRFLLSVNRSSQSAIFSFSALSLL